MKCADLGLLRDLAGVRALGHGRYWVLSSRIWGLEAMSTTSVTRSFPFHIFTFHIHRGRTRGAWALGVDHRGESISNKSRPPSARESPINCDFRAIAGGTEPLTVPYCLMTCRYGWCCEALEAFPYDRPTDDDDKDAGGESASHRDGMRWDGMGKL